MSVAKSRISAALVDRRYNLIWATKKAPTHGEKGLQIFFALLIFPRLMMPGLDLAPAVEIAFNRLPWFLRASPSTTRHESVKSTDADKLMRKSQVVNRFFREKQLTPFLDERISKLRSRDKRAIEAQRQSRFLTN
jgi:hypothetical protein